MQVLDKPKKVKLDRKKLWAICQSVTDHSRAARLLNMVGIFHASYKPLKHGWGSKWGYGYAYTGEEWAERSGHSLRTHARALKELVEAELLEVYPGKLGVDKKTWVRLTERGSKCLFGDAVFDHAWHGLSRHIGVNLDTQAIVKRCTCAEEQSAPAAPPASSTTSITPAALVWVNSEGKEVFGKEQVGTMATVKDILKLSEDKSRVADTLETPAGLDLVWRKVINKHYGLLVPEGTIKQKGQFKHFIRTIRATCGLKPSTVLRVSIQEWSGFVSRVSYDTGTKHTPGKPELGFLLKNVGVAINFVLTYISEQKKDKAKNTGQISPSVQLIAPGVPKLPAETVEDIKKVHGKKMTLEELQAIQAIPDGSK